MPDTCVVKCKQCNELLKACTENVTGKWIVTGAIGCKHEDIEMVSLNDVPSSDELEKIGFQFDDENTMYQYVTKHGSGPQVIVSLEGNSRSDNFMFATGLSIYWIVSTHPTKISGSFSITDNPTMFQIMGLLKALRGE